MEPQRLIFSLFHLLSTLLLTGHVGVHGDHHHHHHQHHQHHHHQHHHHHHETMPFVSRKLFVFGDSYADTGNQVKQSASWNIPYGMTFPGKPSGRFSDGLVLTDYVAKYLKLKTPIPYAWTKFDKESVKYGMNFAYGGTGVFKTLHQGPNMTQQIGFFQQLIGTSVFSAADVQSSVALVTLSGNDYNAAMADNTSTVKFLIFIKRVVNQLVENLKSIHSLGINKVVVAGLQPLGCLPKSTVSSSFQTCNSTRNLGVLLHNVLLSKGVVKLNLLTEGRPIRILNLYRAFSSVFENKNSVQEFGKFENPYKPCCFGTTDTNSCGDVDVHGAKLYTVCGNPSEVFFWDDVHPTQAGWNATYLALQNNLKQVFS